MLEGCVWGHPQPSILASAEGRLFVLDGELKLRGWLERGEGGFVLMSRVAPSPARARGRRLACRLLPRKG